MGCSEPKESLIPEMENFLKGVRAIIVACMRRSSEMKFRSI